MKIFDAHFHIINSDYPLIANQGYLPHPFTIADYLQQTKTFNIVGGAVVSGSFQGFDQEYLCAALGKLGKNFVGVTQVSNNISDKSIHLLAQKGIRALRFNLHRGSKQDLKQIITLAKRVHEITNWHVEFYINTEQLSAIKSKLLSLPAVSIDHLGLEKSSLSLLLSLVEKGVKVKASGFGRLHFNIAKTLIAIHATNPNALMFGTDLPSTRAKRPFAKQDVTLIQQHFNTTDLEKIFYANAANFYRLI